jgi:hypothetical protein
MVLPETIAWPVKPLGDGLVRRAGAFAPVSTDPWKDPWTVRASASGVPLELF